MLYNTYDMPYIYSIIKGDSLIRLIRANYIQTTTKVHMEYYNGLITRGRYLLFVRIKFMSSY